MDQMKNVAFMTKDQTSIKGEKIITIPEILTPPTHKLVRVTISNNH